MKPATVRRCSHDLLKNPNITATVDRLKREEQDRLKHKYQVDNDRVMTELSRITFSDRGKLFGTNGNLLPPHQIDEDTRLALAGVDMVARKNSEGNE